MWVRAVAVERTGSIFGIRGSEGGKKRNANLSVIAL